MNSQQRDQHNLAPQSLAPLRFCAAVLTTIVTQVVVTLGVIKTELDARSIALEDDPALACA